MKTKNYEFLANDDGLWFEFESVSTNKKIKKVVVFEPFTENSEIYNLALGDILENGEVSDVSISNNDDFEKVISTVFQIILRFFQKYPNYSIFFSGSTPERTRLYRIILSKELLEAEKLFYIYGNLDDKLEKFRPNSNYQSFLLSLKNEILLTKYMN